MSPLISTLSFFPMPKLVCGAGALVHAEWRRRPIKRRPKSCTLREGESQLSLQLRETARDSYAVTLQLLCSYQVAITLQSRNYACAANTHVQLQLLRVALQFFYNYKVMVWLQKYSIHLASLSQSTLPQLGPWFKPVKNYASGWHRSFDLLPSLFFVTAACLRHILRLGLKHVIAHFRNEFTRWFK